VQKIINDLKFNSEFLIPAIVQDHKDNTVLMLGYMNTEAIKMTLKTRKVTFWSRSRQSLWVKGETSGHIQRLVEFFYDCDADCILLKVNQIGGAACHTGYKSCFFIKVCSNKNIKVVGKKIFNPHKIYKK
jgi:phosphoribosyl-AMP cyclohydrolase